MLDEPSELQELLARTLAYHWFSAGGTAPLPEEGEMYCPACGGSRRMQVIPLYWPSHNEHAGPESGVVRARVVPSLSILKCVQCKAQFTAVIYKGPAGDSLAILPSIHGGLTTARTPEGVAYYLDQAHRAQSVGANSGAMAMFRGALEQLLFEQGYRGGMLSQKISDLCQAVKDGKAPKWAIELETDFLTVIKELGNASIHPNDGDVTKQSAFDTELLAKVKDTFSMLLYLVYEVPYAKSSLLAGLRSKVLKK